MIHFHYRSTQETRFTWLEASVGEAEERRSRRECRKSFSDMLEKNVHQIPLFMRTAVFVGLLFCKLLPSRKKINQEMRQLELFAESRKFRMLCVRYGFERSQLTSRGREKEKNDSWDCRPTSHEYSEMLWTAFIHSHEHPATVAVDTLENGTGPG